VTCVSACICIHAVLNPSFLRLLPPAVQSKEQRRKREKLEREALAAAETSVAQDDSSADEGVGDSPSVSSPAPATESKKSKKKRKRSRHHDDGDDTLEVLDDVASRGVIYLGNVPHGFYEKEMRSYFEQYGEVTRIRLSRNKKTGHFKHYAFVEFRFREVAVVAAKSNNNYMLFNHVRDNPAPTRAGMTRERFLLMVLSMVLPHSCVHSTLLSPLLSPLFVCVCVCVCVCV
jgi:RNA recognition motif